MHGRIHVPGYRIYDTVSCMEGQLKRQRSMLADVEIINQELEHLMTNVSNDVIKLTA
jgi:hypothetical protein